MAYQEKVVNIGNVIEVMKYINGRVGTKEQREKAAATRTTPEEQLKWQSKEAERKVWRILRNPKNFQAGDLWVTLTYPAGSRPESEQVRGDTQKFLKKIRREYKKQGKECKYVYSVGRGKKGAVHLHFVLKKIDTEIIARTWEKIVNNGEWVHVHAEHMDKSGNYQKLAAYIIKNGEETFFSADPIIKKRFSYSRNIEIKKVKAKTIRARAWKKDAPEKKGYYIDKNLSYSGINRYGYPVQYTVYIKIGAGGIQRREENHEREREKVLCGV